MVTAQDFATVTALTFILALFFTWLIRGLMRRFGILDIPEDGRKKHPQPVAYEGGLAIYLACLGGLILAAYLVPTFFFERDKIAAVVAGTTLAVALGVADDMLDLRPFVKLLGQIGLGVFMYYHGFRIERISNPFGEEMIVHWLVGLGGTVIWYALLMNGINMIDGVDGLAAGIVGISSLTLFAIALDLDHLLGAMLALILFGACMGFLPFNFSPATIFMGDAGSLLLGFMLASITLLSNNKAPALLALLIPMLAVGLPLFETTFAFIRRTFRGEHPFRADRRHLHHRFLMLGFSDRRTVLTFYYITAYLGVTAYVLQRMEPKSMLPLVLVVAIGLFVLVENLRFLEQRLK